MRRLRDPALWLFLLTALAAAALALFFSSPALASLSAILPWGIGVAGALLLLLSRERRAEALVLAVIASIAAMLVPIALIDEGQQGEKAILIVLLIGTGGLVWRMLDLLGSSGNPLPQRAQAILVPAAFGAWLLYLWEVGVDGFGVPRVLLPPPSAIYAAIAQAHGTLWQDFHQTFIRSVIPGFALGCGAGFLTALLVDRVPFLKRGLLPLGNLVSALPIIGVAPIMVMWFGFDWQSKAAVVVIMTFFPMLVNSMAGLAATDRLEQDLMRSYGASYGQMLWRVRLPNAMPFIFNALKINSTLALIGAIVAEFFGTPIVGMGFRISTEVGRMNIAMVWASIAVAAVAGSAFYGILALLERRLTFWHPSYRVGG